MIHATQTTTVNIRKQLHQISTYEDMPNAWLAQVAEHWGKQNLGLWFQKWAVCLVLWCLFYILIENIFNLFNLEPSSTPSFENLKM